MSREDESQMGVVKLSHEDESQRGGHEKNLGVYVIDFPKGVQN